MKALLHNKLSSASDMSANTRNTHTMPTPMHGTFFFHVCALAKKKFTGTLMMYYWCTFLLRLTFGSFVTAVLVGSFNATRAEIEKEEATNAARLAGMNIHQFNLFVL